MGCLCPRSQIRKEVETTQEATEISSSFPWEILPKLTCSLTTRTEAAGSKRGTNSHPIKLAFVGAPHLESRDQGQKVPFVEITKYKIVRLEMEMVEVVRIFFPFPWIPNWELGEGHGRSHPAG